MEETGTGPVAATTDTAPAVIDGSRALESLSPAQMDTWREKGTLPDSIQIVKPDAAPAGDDAPAVDAAGKAVTDAAGAPVSKRQQKRDEAQRQINETIRLKAVAESRAEAAERRLAELEARQPVPAASQTQGQPAAVGDKEPVLEDFLDQPDPYLAHGRAVAKWEVRQEFAARDAKTQETQAQSAAAREIHGAVQTYQERENAFKATIPDFDARTLPLRQLLDVSKPFDREILASEVAPQLILHLAENPEITRRIGALADRNYTAALRELVRLEATLTTASPAAAAAEPANPITSAPKPPTVLGTRPADAADAVESALKRKDAGAYIREANARELAAARR